MRELAVILGTSGPKLTAAESVFFRDANPWGFILFGRNIETPAQVRRLCADLREAVGRDCLIFIDQEGGRVRRLRPPHWRDYPAASKFSHLPVNDPSKRRRAAYLSYRLIADDLRALGVTANCAPVIDLPQRGADPIISDRAFDENVSGIVDMAHACMAGLMAGGVAPVIKHIPGHGRAKVDSHKALPVIKENLDLLDKTDFLPFSLLNDSPMAMTAHAVYTDCCDQALTVSPKAMKALVRGRIGYDGLVMSDDLNMKALSGGLRDLTERTLAADCDIALQCNGKMADMAKVVTGAKRLDGKALARARIAENCADHITEFDRQAANAEFDHLMGLGAESFVTKLPDPTENWAAA